MHPWINFNGNAEEAFTLYKSVLGGEFAHITRFKDVAGPDSPAAPEEGEKIMRIALLLPSGSMLIGNDVPSVMGAVSENENRSKIYLAADTKEEAERFSLELSAGGQVEVPFTDAFSMFRDRYGIEWIVEVAPSA